MDATNEFHQDQTRREHFLQIIKLFRTQKRAKAKVVILGTSESKSFQSNSEGYFAQIIKNQDGLKFKQDDNIVIPIEFMGPEPATKKIIISDIDDTIIKSRAVSLTSLIFKTLFCPLSKREPFPEAASFYKKMQSGLDQDKKNLFFYVSSSTWVLYPLLKAFLQINGFPKGPLILQDIKTEKNKQGAKKHQHKFDRIQELIQFYPEYQFQLIGDAGQRDAAIYLDIAKKYPDKIDFILIRETWWNDKMSDSTRFIEAAKNLGIKMIYFKDLEKIAHQIDDDIR